MVMTPSVLRRPVPEYDRGEKIEVRFWFGDFPTRLAEDALAESGSIFVLDLGMIQAGDVVRLAPWSEDGETMAVQGINATTRQITFDGVTRFSHYLDPVLNIADQVLRLQDATAPVFEYIPPGLAKVTGPTPQRISPGYYTAPLSLTTSGIWHYRGSSTGQLQTAAWRTFKVRYDAFQ